MTYTAEQLSVKLLHEEEVVAEARQVAAEVLAFHGQYAFGLAQQGLLDDSLVEFDLLACVDALAEEVLAVGNFQDGE